MEENYFLSRKSCRNFSKEKISEKKLKEIIFKAMKAPTCGNMQLYSVIATLDNDDIKQQAKYHFNQPAATTAACILTICADFNRFTHWCKNNKADAGYDNFHSFIMAFTDAIIFAQQIVTVAENSGLASCYLGTVNYNAKEISEMLKLPELVVPVASIALGVCEIEGEETKRLPVEAVFHMNCYREDSDDQIEDFFKVLTQDPNNEKFIKENKKENLAQVFSEIRYPRKVNEEVSKSFLKLIKEKGF